MLIETTHSMPEIVDPFLRAKEIVGVKLLGKKSDRQALKHELELIETGAADALKKEMRDAAKGNSFPDVLPVRQHFMRDNLARELARKALKKSEHKMTHSSLDDKALITAMTKNLANHYIDQTEALCLDAWHKIKPDMQEKVFPTEHAFNEASAILGKVFVMNTLGLFEKKEMQKILSNILRQDVPFDYDIMPALHAPETIITVAHALPSYKGR